MKRFINLILICCLILGATTLASCNDKSTHGYTLGVWWWDNRLDDSYLEYAVDNDVDEIYFYTSTFSESNNEFIKKANNNKIDVYWLCGDYRWIEDYSSFQEKMNDFLNYQIQNTIGKFEGVHLDVEPHQHEEFDSRREELILLYIDFLNKTTNDYPQVHFDADIPFWLEDVVTYNGETKEAYKFVVDIVNRVFVMSYRDSAEQILNVGSAELEYANQNNKPVFLCVETGNEEDIVTFLEEGKKYMNEQIALLEELTNLKYNIAIHHIKTWRELKD